MGNLISTYEESKKYIFVINRGTKGQIILEFKNENFYHLTGLHKININMFIPNKIKSMDKKYKYIKNNIDKFNSILENQIKEKNEIELRINTFHNVLDLLKNNEKTLLYNVKQKMSPTLYNGDFALLKIYENINCLLGLKVDNIIENDSYCAPQSWMASNRINKLVSNRMPIYMQNISMYLKNSNSCYYN